jgi:translation initiation factor IF-2
MKKIEKLNQSKLPIAIYDKKLDKLENMPLFQKKVDLANAILVASPPTLFLRKRENKRIKQYFEQGFSIEQIAKNIDFTKHQVLLRLEEMGLVMPILKGVC